MKSDFNVKKTFVPRFAFTPGEPAGIGIDLSILLAQSKLNCELVCFSNRQLLLSRAKLLNLPLEIINFNNKSSRTLNKKYQIKLIDYPLTSTVIPGKLNQKNADFVLQTLFDASKFCINKQMDGLITGAIHKGIINQSGVKFTGHTEFLQTKSNTKKVVMMLLNDKMKVALATTHLPLKSVAQNINKQQLIETLKILHRNLVDKFNIKSPKILISGLNPHAGENGCFGMEEIHEIIPAIQYCKNKFNMDLEGPLPADTLFTTQYLQNADAVLVMYHDQGLPVLKYAGFGNSVNITLGLPFIRVSVDHGTALDLVGTGKVSVSSLDQAINLAIKIANNQQ